MWRVVETDNLVGDYPNESFVGPCFCSKERAQKIADIINEDQGERGARYWKVESEDYKLQPGFEP